VRHNTVGEPREVSEPEWAAEMRGWAGKRLGGESPAGRPDSGASELYQYRGRMNFGRSATGTSGLRLRKASRLPRQNALHKAVSSWVEGGSTADGVSLGGTELS
jgi:hypothetical protein